VADNAGGGIDISSIIIQRRVIADIRRISVDQQLVQRKALTNSTQPSVSQTLLLSRNQLLYSAVLTTCRRARLENMALRIQS
jgi:hypothetical protein